MFFFAFLSLYNLVVVNRMAFWDLTDMTYSCYCVDFSFGFASKLLPGAIFNALFGSHASRETATIFATVIVLIFFVGLSLLLERFMLKMPEFGRNAAFVLVLFFLSGSYTFSIYTGMLGLIDTWWLLVALLFFVFLENRWLRFLIPFLFALSLMIHFSALVFVITLFSIVLLYKTSCSRENRDRKTYAVIFAFSMLITAVGFFLIILNEGKTLCSVEEFHEKLLERGTSYFHYFDYSFFHDWFGYIFVPDYVQEVKPFFLKFFCLFYYQIKLNLYIASPHIDTCLLSTVSGFLVLIPAVSFIIRFHCVSFKNEKDKLKKFCSLLMIAQFPFVFILGLLFATSIDITRYYSHSFTVLLSCFIYVLFSEEKKRELFFEQFGTFENTVFLKLYYLIYASAILPVCL